MVGVLLGFIALIVLGNRLLQKTGKIHPEIIRKTPHILSGLVIMYGAVTLPKVSFLGFISVIFLLALVSYRNKKRFPGVYSVTRRSYGTILYPLSILILAVFLLPEEQEGFLYAVGMMVIVDGFTAIFGSIFGKQIPYYQKSFLGSSVFFALGSLLGIYLGLPIFLSILFSLVITIHEFFVRWGLDNFTIPILSAILWVVFG